MIVIQTQFMELVNITNFDSIHVEINSNQDTKEKTYIIVDNNGHTYGMYYSEEIALRIINYLAEAISKYNTATGMVIKMPYIKEEMTNEEQAQSNS